MEGGSCDVDDVKRRRGPPGVERDTCVTDRRGLGLSSPRRTEQETSFVATSSARTCVRTRATLAFPEMDLAIAGGRQWTLIGRQLTAGRSVARIGSGSLPTSQPSAILATGVCAVRGRSECSRLRRPLCVVRGRSARRDAEPFKVSAGAGNAV
ncbi:hypothetical protein HPB50_004796 [Hyalomma asiaticum]|uniref:Uncharacterized protein n=1 Tax=Hyalomma asiaticum TaxID=266040 RepID=A0ACB7SQ21_HYAAI|nr:hypothetical protein HPB50_004796 [Hyalomma asiaticum]